MRVFAPIMVALLAACAAQPDPPSPSLTPSTAGTAPAATADSGPSTATDLLECDAGPSDVGGFGEGVAVESSGGATPDEALDAFLATTFFVIPRSGYEPIGRSGDRHAYAYRADGEVKVVVVVSTRFADLVGAAFAADELRTCPQPEFGAEAEFDDGRRVWAHLETGQIVTDIPGPQHCEWQSARLMHLLNADGTLDRQYVRDPHGVLGGWPLLESYAEDVQLPDNATDSGYRSPEGFELWFTESDTAAYVVTPESVERWPRAVEPIGCA